MNEEWPAGSNILSCRSEFVWCKLFRQQTAVKQQGLGGCTETSMDAIAECRKVW
jgi:hypothetical protein